MGNRRDHWVFLMVAAAVCLALVPSASGVSGPAAFPEDGGGGRLLLAGLVVAGAAAVAAVGIALRKRGLERGAGRSRGGPAAP
jgi:hypothetical protein